MAGATDLFDLCAEYLEAAADAIATTPGGALERAYVSPGVPAFDCEQITVHAGGPAIGDTMPLSPPLQPGHRIQESGTVNLVAMTCTVVRCVPVGTESGGVYTYPDPGALEAAAQETLADMWAIWSCIKTRFRRGTLFVSDLGRNREFFIDPAVAVPIAGGFGGWQAQIRVQLDGYDFEDA